MSKELSVKEIVKLLTDNSIEASNLDDTIHQASSSLATNANNGGLEAQIIFLHNTCGWNTEAILTNTMDSEVAETILKGV